MTKNKKAFWTLLFVLLVMALVTTPVTHAQTTTGLPYKLLEKIPGTDGLSGSDLPGYVSAIYKVALVIVTLSAVLMLTIGGFMYLTSAGNTASMGSAKGIIYDSLIGLVIALSAWLILYVINPDLVQTSLGTLTPITATSDTSSTPTTPGPTTGPIDPGDGYYIHADAVAALSAAGISVTSSGNCSDMNNATCTSLDTIPKSTIANLIKLKAACGCSFNVTGGTETGHVSHGIQKPIVDVSESAKLAEYLQKELAANKLPGTDNITAICASKTYVATTRYNCGGYVEAKAHFHLQFKP